MREEASKKGKIIMTCKAGRVVTVLRVGDVYTRIVYDGVEGLVLNSCLKFYETPDEDAFTTGLLSAKGKTNTTATVSVYQLTKITANIGCRRPAAVWTRFASVLIWP